MSNNTLRRNGKVYREVKLDDKEFLKFLSDGKLVDLSKPQNAIEVDIGAVYEIEENER